MIERESAGKLLVETKREDSEGRIYTPHTLAARIPLIESPLVVLSRFFEQQSAECKVLRE